CHHLLSYAAPYSTAARKPKESAVIDLLHCSGAPAKLFTLRWAPAAVNQRRRVSRDDGRNPAVAALAYFAATAGSTSFANSCNEVSATSRGVRADAGTRWQKSRPSPASACRRGTTTADGPAIANQSMNSSSRARACAAVASVWWRIS